MSVKLLNFENKNFQCILGMNILGPLKAIIDFSKNTLVVRNNVIPFNSGESLFNSGDQNEIQQFNAYYTDEEKFPYFNPVEKNNVNIEALLVNCVNEEEKQMLKNFLNKYKSIFYQDGQLLSATSSVKHKIITTPHVPIYCRNYRYPYALEEEINKQIDEMLLNKIIRPSKSPYNSPLWIVEKKTDNSLKKKWRLVIDFRKLNSVTVDDKFPLPNIEDLFEKLGRAHYFSTIDLAKGFHQVHMDPNDVEKTAFSTHKGHFEFLRMPFGLKNAPATFQRMINNVLSDFVNKICIIYMDDILVFSSSLTEHIESLTKIFKKLMENNLKVQFDKCQFLSRQTKFLGHIITPEGIKPSAEKVLAVQQVKLPSSLTEIKSFLGLTGFYRKFINNYSLIASPILKYLKKDTKIDVNDIKYIEAFNKLKTIITSPPLLVFPKFDKPFLVTSDASDLAVGAVLSQEGKPICFASRTLNGFERKYHTLEKELLAIVWAIRYFRPYLYGRKFVVQTDHQPLKWLYSMKEPSARIFRWKSILNDYDFEVEYIQGKENNVADFLSRIKYDSQQEGSENIDIKSLFEISLQTTSFPVDTFNDYYQVSKFLVNKYLTQIRIVKQKEKEFEKLYNKYNIIYVSLNDIDKNSYLTDLFRKYIKKGKVGIYSELGVDDCKIVLEKLKNLFSAERQLSFTLCTQMAKDISTKEEILKLIEEVHNSGNHRGIEENFEELKWIYFYPNLKNLINKYINYCRICNENKYERKPVKKLFNITETPENPNEIVHMDIFYVCKQMFLTSIDKFTKMATAHKLSDKNMSTVIVKLQERISWLGKPQKLIMDNEFNNALIKLFCNENNIVMHFSTPNSHTGNSDVERLHSTLLEHVRIIKNSNTNIDIEETVLKAVGFYNNTIHKTINLKPMDFLNKSNLDFKEIREKIISVKNKTIEKLNAKGDKPLKYDEENLFLRNPLACRNKTAKRFIKITKSYPNKIDIDQIKRPSKLAKL